MQSNKPSKRTSPGAAASGVKFLITAASLTAVVGGWAVFSLKQPAENAQAETTTIVLPPLPTLVAQPRQAAQPGQPAADANISASAPDAPVLRSVSIPQPSANSAPPPVTNTRSSR